MVKMPVTIHPTPTIPPELIEYLEAAFPPVDPTPSDTLAELHFRGGQRSVIRFLRRKLTEREDKLIT